MKRNFSAYLFANSFSSFGMSLVSSGVILPLFVSNLSSSRFLVGLIMTLSFAGWMLPQIFTAPIFGRLKRIKRPLLGAMFFADRLPLLLWGPAVFFLARDHPQALLVVFFLLLAWNSFGSGSTAVGAQELLARAVQVENRGRLMGVSGAVGIGLGLGGAALNQWVLGSAGFPNGYGLLFSLAGGCLLASWVWLWRVREPQAPLNPAETRAPLDYRAFFRRIPALLRADRNYSRFLLAMGILYLGGMSGNFLAVAARARFNLPESIIVTFPVGLYIGQALGSLACGWIADRRGYKILQIIANAANVILLVAAIFARAPWLFYMVFALKGISTAADILGNMITLEFSSAEQRPAYIGIYNTASGFVFLFSPLLAGWLADRLDYDGLFWITAGITLVGIVLLIFTVRDPREKRVSAPASGGALAGE